jgi:hypothetical protein
MSCGHIIYRLHRNKEQKQIETVRQEGDNRVKNTVAGLSGFEEAWRIIDTRDGETSASKRAVDAGFTLAR